MSKGQHLGKREREARKRRRRASACCAGTNFKWLKLGRKHFSRHLNSIMCVADSRKLDGNNQGA